MKNRLTDVILLILAFILPPLTAAGGETRTLSFYHTHTDNEVEVTYYENGEYVASAMQLLRVFLADWRDGKQNDIDPAVLDILWQIQAEIGRTGTWEVISAYRSPETNAMLNKRSNSVAKRSQHLQGKAIDVRMRGEDTKKLQQVALELKLGGVGYYEQSDFIHVDTGRVRRW